MLSKSLNESSNDNSFQVSTQMLKEYILEKEGISDENFAYGQKQDKERAANQLIWNIAYPFLVEQKTEQEIQNDFMETKDQTTKNWFQQVPKRQEASLDSFQNWDDFQSEHDNFQNQNAIRKKSDQLQENKSQDLEENQEQQKDDVDDLGDEKIDDVNKRNKTSTALSSKQDASTLPSPLILSDEQVVQLKALKDQTLYGYQKHRKVAKKRHFIFEKLSMPIKCIVNYVLGK